ncbi:MAG: transcription antitermination factor NusB [Symbiobacteriaceae bacterium]|nr:transcription antitermination factor NusB [Symbiobacteriaceae bacterium]
MVHLGTDNDSTVEASITLTRRQERELILAVLFQLEFEVKDSDELLQNALDILDMTTALNASVLSFSRQMLRGISRRRGELDEILQSFAKDWSLERIGRLERSILRMALYELIWQDDIPPAATLDEAVELTKSYCAVEASAFINGILGNIHKHLEESRRNLQFLS